MVEDRSLFDVTHALVDKKTEFKLHLSSHNSSGASDLHIFYSHFVPGSDMMLLGIFLLCSGLHMTPVQPMCT